MANSLMINREQERPLNIVGDFAQGAQLRSVMENNALAPQRRQALEQSNEANRLTLEDYSRDSGLRARQREAQIGDLEAKAEIDRAKAFYIPSKKLAIIYPQVLKQVGGDEQAAAQAMEMYYAPIRDKARANGLDASDTYDHRENLGFIQTLDEVFGKKEPSTQVWAGDAGTETLYEQKGGKASPVLGPDNKPLRRSKAEKSSAEDMALVRQTIKDLPKTKAEAAMAANSVSNIDNALQLLDTGKVTGKSGALKAWIAPYAESIGLKTEGMDDAAQFKAITQLIRGPMRAEIIGPGQVSNYEQQLLSEMGGGGGTAAAAAKKLLTYYKKAAQVKVDTYNQELVGAEKLVPEIANIHKPIKIGGTSSIAPQSKSVGRFTVEEEK